MGLMDKIKETAQGVAVEAKKAGTQAQGKVEEVQLRRRLDDAARRLGYLVFRERVHATPAGSDADTLLDEMRDLDEAMARQRSGPASPGASDPGRASPSAGDAGEGQPPDQPN